MSCEDSPTSDTTDQKNAMLRPDQLRAKTSQNGGVVFQDGARTHRNILTGDAHIRLETPMPKVVEYAAGARHASDNDTRNAFLVICNHRSAESSARMVSNHSEILPSGLSRPEQPFIEYLTVSSPPAIY